MNDEELKSYRKKKDLELIAFIAGDKPTSFRHIAADYELKRRAKKPVLYTAIAAVVISFISLLSTSWPFLKGLMELLNKK